MRIGFWIRTEHKELKIWKLMFNKELTKQKYFLLKLLLTSMKRTGSCLQCIRASGILGINKFYKNSLSVHNVLGIGSTGLPPGLDQPLVLASEPGKWMS